MQTVRTTITLPADLHRQLRLQAIQASQSLGDFIAKKLSIVISSPAPPTLTRLADSVVGSVSKKQSGWKDVQDLSQWQSAERQHADRC
jgi:hypothetical protein